MEYAIIAFLCFALFHLVYESIIAPSLRLKYSFDLFKARDAVRLLKMEHGDQLDGKHYEYLQDSINILLKSLHNLDATILVAAMHEINNDKALQARIEERMKIFDDCKLPEANAIRKKTLLIANNVLLVNNGGWIIYLIPIFIVALFYKTITNYVKEIYSLSERDFNRITPDKNFAH